MEARAKSHLKKPLLAESVRLFREATESLTEQVYRGLKLLQWRRSCNNVVDLLIRHRLDHHQTLQLSQMEPKQPCQPRLTHKVTSSVIFAIFPDHSTLNLWPRTSVSIVKWHLKMSILSSSGAFLAPTRLRGMLSSALLMVKKESNFATPATLKHSIKLRMSTRTLIMVILVHHQFPGLLSTVLAEDLVLQSTA